MSSGVAPSATRSFASINDIDFGSSAGLQELLRVVRNTPMNREDYNQLRDLVFSYKQKGDAPEVKQQIETTLQEIGVIAAGATMQQADSATPAPAPVASEVAQPDTNEKSTPEVNKVPIRVETAKEPAAPSGTHTRTGMMRPQPAFGAPASVTAPAHSEPESTPVEPEPTPPPTEAAQPVDATLAETLEEKPVEPLTPATASEQPEPVQSTPAAPETALNYGSPLERVKEIKKEVNAMVGNPVNLIDANNEIGREYMNALLDAMKKINGGETGEVNAAMTRLETAFTAVKGVHITKPTPAPEPAPESVAIESSSQSDLEPEAPTAEPVGAAPLVPPAPPVPPADEVTSSTALGDSPATATETGASLPKSALFTPVAPAEDTKSAEATAEGFMNTPDVTKNIEAVASPEPAAETAENSAASVPSSNAAGGFTSVATEKKQLDSQAENAMADIKAQQEKRDADIAQMEPTMIPEVTNGLNQLLSEWKLFKSSGIFGTGPSGAEHPLYKKLANMQMSAVIAGRFDDATPEIKQSITDYMNGWRYEEGILHQHGETFEHYLRRVIKKILDKQSQPAA